MAGRFHQLLPGDIAHHPLAQHPRLGLAQFLLPAQELPATRAPQPSPPLWVDVDWSNLLLIARGETVDGFELALQPRLQVLALALIHHLDIGPKAQLGAALLQGIGVHHRGGLRRFSGEGCRDARPQAWLHQPGPAGDQGYHQGHQDDACARAATPGRQHLTRHLQPQQLPPETLEPSPELGHGAQASHGEGMTGPHASPAVAC